MVSGTLIVCIYQRIYCLKVTQGGNVMGGQNTFDTLNNYRIITLALCYNCLREIL